VIILSGFHCTSNGLWGHWMLTLLMMTDNVIKMFQVWQSLIALSFLSYLYQLVNVISFSMSQSDSIKRLPQYFKWHMKPQIWDHIIQKITLSAITLRGFHYTSSSIRGVKYFTFVQTLLRILCDSKYLNNLTATWKLKHSK
jgi:hypothetical protein